LSIIQPKKEKKKQAYALRNPIRECQWQNYPLAVENFSPISIQFCPKSKG